MTSNPTLSSTGAPPPVPSVIDGYRVEGVLGRGASGIVLRVRDDALDRSIALKLLTDDLDAGARARFLIEAKAAARIVHPNVVQVFGVGNHEGRAFITQELVEGYPLAMLLEARGRLSPEAVIDVGIQVASGLARAAEVGVLHRDVKPQNLLITEAGLVKLADFGLAKILNAPSSLTDTGTTLGTPHYMSPEQGLGLPLDARADQYSLGATLYHLLCGEPPFHDDNALALLLKHKEASLVPLEIRAPDVPKPLSRIVERMLEKAPADRFEGFEDVVEALEALFEEPSEEHDTIRHLFEGIDREATPQVTPLPSVEARSATDEQRRLPAWVINAAVAVAAVAVFGVAIFGGSRFGTTRPKARPIREEVPVEAAAPPARRDLFRPPPVQKRPKPRPKKRLTEFEQLLRELDTPRTAAAAAKALGELGDHRATAPLIEALQDQRHEAASVAAARALGQLGDIKAIAPLRTMAEKGRTASIRAAAEQAKKRLWSVEE